MTFVTHIIGGAASVALMDTILPSFTADKMAFIVGGIVATLPDVDYSRSFVGRILYPVSRYLESHTGHRTFTHSFLCSVLVSVVLGFILSFFSSSSLLQWAVVVFMSYTSHILLDWFTKKGTQYYWPASVWCVMPKNRSWRIQTGTTPEAIFVVLLLSLFTVTFQPSREATIAWFRSSFIQSKDGEFERFEIKRAQATHGLSMEQIDSLHNIGIITNREKENMLYELQNIDINERTTRRMYGLPDRNTGDVETRGN